MEAGAGAGAGAGAMAAAAAAASGVGASGQAPVPASLEVGDTAVIVGLAGRAGHLIRSYNGRNVTLLEYEVAFSHWNVHFHGTEDIMDSKVHTKYLSLVTKANAGTNADVEAWALFKAEKAKAEAEAEAAAEAETEAEAGTKAGARPETEAEAEAVGAGPEAFLNRLVLLGIHNSRLGNRKRKDK